MGLSGKITDYFSNCKSH